jgi:hypothetical protein
MKALKKQKETHLMVEKIILREAGMQTHLF